MSDEIKTTDNVVAGETQQEGQQAAEQNQTVINPDEFNKIKEQMKKIQSNFDRVNTEKQKLDSELKKEREKTLTSKQLEELKQQEFESELRRREQELQNKTLLFEKTKILNEKKWDNDLLDLITGNTIEEFNDNVLKFNNKLKFMVDRELQTRLASSNPIPQAGKNNLNDVFTVDEIEKNKNNKQWMHENFDKVKKSIQYHNSK